MNQIIAFRPPLPNVDTLWAVIAQQGRQSRIADVHASQSAAEADRDWRAQQVRAYTQFLIGEQQPLPRYSVRSIRRAELPRAWRPLPALGFLRGRFV
ncbi:hypothetical protein AA101099_2664 [Neoasaia chiangmaiensis NBRC 101099]|uniref:Uncharacterized protein n=1 Tax=Neoasaia chiangmaiensis TaxID=320497 RepID=A0A1U9KPE3_9PROT|nr:hypothetical protein [Neoasaia chiangmaiensis]AQS87674.1 hypothetical protein A0U93_06725 [Neoasaia chiangmaiensis]GBR41888.1 hypothetical protein AA101099_2664 [Neoasaia chiangmaiensis NBRC 101099]GEN14258.1 hypothetical protein NCH01_06890 [Neoasaia chiangmaiensis]